MIVATECRSECIWGTECIFLVRLSQIKDFLECRNEGRNSKS